jgi:hypothetical protein
MLQEYEKNSLKLIFERVTPDKITGVIETLLECYKEQYSDDYSMEVIEILEKTVKNLKKVEIKPS